MKRLNDYDVRLIDFAEGVLNQPFVWGKTNCGALAAAAIDAMFGTDLFTTSISARCTSAPRGLALSRRHETTRVLRDFGMEVVPPAFRQVGDIIVAFDDPWECCHIILGATCLTSSPERGVFFVPTPQLIAEGFGTAPSVANMEVFRCL